VTCIIHKIRNQRYHRAISDLADANATPDFKKTFDLKIVKKL